MSAYSFKRRFIEPIRMGLKTQTIRAVGKRRHARPGEAIQLYHGLRTKQAFKILDPDPKCVSVVPIFMDVGHSKIIVDGKRIVGMALTALAKADGFEDWDDMQEFWFSEHTESCDEFDGLLIKWSPP